MTLSTDALLYHEFPTPGKISLAPTKPCQTVHDLSLAYSPGVAAPCLEIEKNPEDVYKYTSKGNLVAVISNGTAVLGLGDIGPAGAKPVMEGKATLFKSFADIDAFDLELDCKDPKKFVETVVALAPTFGGINLEDIKAPECFYIEEELIKRLPIPVLHDDQHGTAIIVGAALVNALELANKKLENVKIVVNGAGAAGIACARLLVEMGVRKENTILCDSQGVIYKGRSEGMNSYKEEFVVSTAARSLADALDGADVFIGLSKKDALSPKMLLSMAKDPIVFALANPDPEIDYSLAKSTRADIIIATGRSDYPNQANNVLGFPYIFRGALDVRARLINSAMKMAAVRALAALAREAVPDSVKAAYGSTNFTFGRDYFITKPFDPRVLYYVAPAVAKAAMESGVAQQKVDIEEYTLRLKAKQNHGRTMLRVYYDSARASQRKRVAFAEGRNPRVLRAASMALAEGLAQPVLLGKPELIRAEAQRQELDLSGMQIVDPSTSPDLPKYLEAYYTKMQRKGVTRIGAERALRAEHIFANMMLASGDVSAMICGVDQQYPAMAKPVLKLIGPRAGVSTVAGLYIVAIKEKLLFLADTTMNIEMSSEKLAEVAILAAQFVQSMNITPRVAMLSFSNFGSSQHASAKMVRNAVGIVNQLAPHVMIDGEMQVDVAVVPEILKEHYPFSALKDSANILLFPDMQSGNIAYKLLQRFGGAWVVGPVILGLKAPAYVMQTHASVDEIFNMITVAVAQSALA